MKTEVTSQIKIQGCKSKLLKYIWSSGSIWWWTNFSASDQQPTYIAPIWQQLKNCYWTSYEYNLSILREWNGEWADACSKKVISRRTENNEAICLSSAMRSARSCNLGKLCQSISRPAGERTGANLPTAASSYFISSQIRLFLTLSRTFCVGFWVRKMWAAAAASETTTSNGFAGGWEWAEINHPLLAVHFSPHLIGRKLSQTTAHRQPNQSVAKQIAAAPRRITHLCSHFRRPAAKCAKKSPTARNLPNVRLLRCREMQVSLGQICTSIQLAYYFQFICMEYI